uniref:Uncharacterized protein n=1 Tax=Brassica oleracea TaxID=3712 RepID=A0A3P6B1X3_BRAOL|nr:unnamed protein product [Brassica oleracea]
MLKPDYQLDISVYIIILNNANVKLIEGRGKVIDPHTIDVDGKNLNFEEYSDCSRWTSLHT